jgi:hypothetical protein
MKNQTLRSKNTVLNQYFFIAILATQMLLFSSKTFADEMHEYDFSRIEVINAYLGKNPYIMIKNKDTSYLFKAEKVYLMSPEEKQAYEEELWGDGYNEDALRISGPVVLKWVEHTNRWPSYFLPGPGQVYTGMLCGCCYYGYYYAMRVAFPLMDLLSLTGGYDYNFTRTWAFPEPTEIPQYGERIKNNPPDVSSGFYGGLNELPEALKAYALWWYQNASVGPPVLHQLIDSVLSAPEGGPKAPPNIFIDHNHCPSEGCQYGEWKTTESIMVFDQPNSKKQIGVISAGETFTALTGDVYLTPIEVIVVHPFELYHPSSENAVLFPGRKYYILSNIGEGHSKIWINGKIYEIEALYNPSQKWWVKVKTKKGKQGWILYPETGCISGSDYLE